MATEEDRLEQKLAAILYADVVGYSRLTGQDELGTHRKLGACLDAIKALVESHDGKVDHFAGDAVLAELGTASSALTCAVEIQRNLKTRSRDLPEDKRVRFRVGLNLGEVIVDRGDIYGDGVNIAARLESLAQPGGICISEAVHMAVGSKLGLDYVDVGEQRVKNIATPVRAYNVVLDAEPPLTGRWSRRSLTRAGITVILLLLVGSVIGWLKPWESQQEPTPAEGTPYPPPDKPSVVVLPFTNMGGDPEQEYFADGITEDLTTDLSKISGLFVIARNSAFTYKDRTLKPDAVARELGVRYVQEGSARREGNHVRINAQLIDASTGGHLWAERYDGSLGDIFSLQDSVTQSIVAALAVSLTTDEQRSRAEKETANASAYDAFLQGWRHYQQLTAADSRTAISFFERAIALDPQYGRAYAALAATYWQGWKRLWTVALGMPGYHDARIRAEDYLDEAMTNPTPLAYQVVSEMYAHRQEYAKAVTAARRSIAIDPNDADGYVAVAGALSMAGEPEEALRMVQARPGYT